MYSLRYLLLILFYPICLDLCAYVVAISLTNYFLVNCVIYYWSNVLLMYIEISVFEKCSFSCFLYYYVACFFGIKTTLLAIYYIAVSLHLQRIGARDIQIYGA